MSPFDVIQIELARTRERIADLQIEERTLERVLLEVMNHQPLPSPPKDSVPRVPANKPRPTITKRQKNDWTDEEIEASPAKQAPIIQVDAQLEPVVQPHKPTRRVPTFQEQLAKVEAGAGIFEVQPIRKAAPECTLGGVTGPINL